MVAHVANVAWPTLGLCFRMVQDPERGGYPMRCPAPPRWHEVFVNPRGERWTVDACNEHSVGIDQLELNDVCAPFTDPSRAPSNDLRGMI
jgi:hypothetical protein